MANKQSSIEWLREELLKRDMDISVKDLFEQAKAMHKEETIKLYYAYEDYVLREEGIIKTFGQFYNETFGGNND
jgi:type III secretory pathway lipoprotein EscJ